MISPDAYAVKNFLTKTEMLQLMLAATLSGVKDRGLRLVSVGNQLLTHS